MVQESYDAADDVIAALLAKGYDYSEYREKIAHIGLVRVPGVLWQHFFGRMPMEKIWV